MKPESHSPSRTDLLVTHTIRTTHAHRIRLNLILMTSYSLDFPRMFPSNEVPGMLEALTIAAEMISEEILMFPKCHCSPRSGLLALMYVLMPWWRTWLRTRQAVPPGVLRGPSNHGSSAPLFPLLWNMQSLETGMRSKEIL